MKKFSFLLLVLLVTGCATGDENPAKEMQCLQKSFMQRFTLEPGQCVVLKELENKTFTLLGLGSFEKQELTVPAASLSYSLEEVDSFQEWNNNLLHEDYEEEGTSFTGRVHFVADGNVFYTIYVDDMEFVETETEFIFKKMTVRFAEYDPEY